MSFFNREYSTDMTETLSEMMEPCSSFPSSQTTCKRKNQPPSMSSKSTSSRGSYEKYPYWLGDMTGVPTSTSSWDARCLESLGIYYDKDYQAWPFDILDKIFEKRGIFGALDEKQHKYLEDIKQNMQFDSSLQELLSTRTDQEKLQEILSEKLLPEMKKDIQNFRIGCGMSCSPAFMGVHTVVEDFIFSARQVIVCEASYLRDMESRSEQGPASKEMYVEIVRSFARICRLAVGYGSAWKGKMLIQNVAVSSKTDLVLMPLDFFNEPLGSSTLQQSSIVTVVEMKNLHPPFHDRTEQISGQSSDGSDHEFDSEPAIYQKVNSHVLGQHGGQLLLYYRLYAKELVDNSKDWQYFPGILVVGTEVIFTLLEIHNEHLWDLKNAEPRHRRAKIYYSKPKDLLKREDRDLLLESFTRFNNLKN